MLQEELNTYASEFLKCRAALSAIGDETRQAVLVTLIENGAYDGLRVGSIQEKTNLSRPAVSHHLRVLKDTGFVGVRKEGTQNFYYIDTKSSALTDLIHFFRHTVYIMRVYERALEKENK